MHKSRQGQESVFCCISMGPSLGYLLSTDIKPKGQIARLLVSLFT